MFRIFFFENPVVFVQISNGFSFRQNGSYLFGFQKVGLPDFRSHLRSRPVQISDPHCTGFVQYSDPLYSSNVSHIALGFIHKLRNKILGNFCSLPSPFVIPLCPSVTLFIVNVSEIKVFKTKLNR